MDALPLPDKEEKIVELFNEHDINKDGWLSKEELGALLKELDGATWTSAAVDALFESMDVNADSKVQVSEFVNWAFKAGGEFKVKSAAKESDTSEAAGADVGAAELTIVPGKVLESDEDEVPVLVSVKIPDGTERTPSDICCIIDISWSMSMEAVIGTESNGLSLMDVAKHAVRTIIHTLSPQDRLSIVTFCERATTVMDLTAMNDDGKALADKRVEEIGFGSGTALWQGISHGLQNLMAAPAEGRLRHIMLLTDGETADHDLVVPNLLTFKHKHGGLPGTINAFGFGYEIDSPLLVEVAEAADGSYAFIPDAGFVGTVFVNSMSNLLVTVAKNASLTLTPQSGAAIKDVRGQWQVQAADDGSCTVKLGNLQCGQSKDIVLMMSTKATAETYLFAKLECATRIEGGNWRASAKGKAPGLAEDMALVEAQKCRCELVDAITRAYSLATSKACASDEDVEKAHEFLKGVAARLAESPLAEEKPVSALLEDIGGQSSEALSRVDWYRKWGRHYLPSLKMAHKMQLCNNFKDPGVQDYGGKLFGDIRDLADDAFCTLSAPKPTPARLRYYGHGRLERNPDYVDPLRISHRRPERSGSRSPSPAPRPAAAPVSMAAYHDRYGG
mmetsp:Transcript_159585/g.306384  ORF Transcript_159585/g.306384 Transcript_159585/m.306384 type:complete len:618 (-) Transcript_159585:55-1908(-)